MIINKNLKKQCIECNFSKAEKVWTSDSWDNTQKYNCRAKSNKVIMRYVDTFDKVPVPDWCPYKNIKVKPDPRFV